MKTIVVVILILINISVFTQILYSQEIGKSWEFNEDGNFEGIVLGNSLQDSSVINGTLRAKVSGTFPSVSSESFELDASSYGFIQIRMKIPGATSGKIMWYNDTGAWGYKRFFTVGDSSFHLFEIPVYSSNQWVGKITQIMRLDFNPTVGSVIEIDYIRIVRIGAKPTITNFTSLRTTIKRNIEIPFVAVVKNEGDIETHLRSKLTLPENISIIYGNSENDHGILFNELTDSLNWRLLFPELGEYNIVLKLFNETDTTEKIISLNVTDQFWKQKEFLLSAWSPPYAWYGPPYEDSVFTYYKNANFKNALWARDDDILIQKMRQHGLKYFLLITPIFGDLYLRAPDKEIPPDVTETMLQKLDIVIDKYKDDPDLLGYHICDEPHKQAFPNIGKVIERIRKKDPTRLSFVNIWPSGDGYREYIDQLLQITKLQLLSYDRYHFYNGHDGGEYFSNLSVIREYAIKYDIPFCNIVQAIGTNGTIEEQLNWRTPSESEHRWLVYSSLTYGVHALIWFHWHLDWGVTGNPDREIIYPSIKKINAEIDSLKNIMVKLKTTGVYHTIINEDKWKLPPDGIIKSVSDNADLVVGYFKNENNDDYFMLMNKDYSDTSFTEVTINYILNNLEVFNVENDKWEDVPFENSYSGATFNVFFRAGAGKLFRFKGETIVDISEATPTLQQFNLEQNYPNPFNPSTTIKYSIPDVGIKHTSFVQLKIYDILGREVVTLVNKEQKSGNYEIKFDASILSTGIYLYKLQAGKYFQTKKWCS